MGALTPHLADDRQQRLRELADGMKAVIGDSTVDANGAIITLTEGQTFASFSLVSDTEITADQLGSITAQYQSDSALGNSGAGSGTVSSISSNTWGLTLSDAGEQDNTVVGDYNVLSLTNSIFPIMRTNADGQTITVLEVGDLFYQRGSGLNLFADPNGELVTDNALYGSTQRDKIEGLVGSDLIAGFGGNDQLDGGEGADMIGGGAGADHILGGAGDDYISSSADVNLNHQAYSSTDIWSNYGLPAGKDVVSAQALWGVYKDGAGNDAVTVWSGMGNTRTDTAATEGDVIDAGAGNDNVIGSWAGDRIQGGEQLFTTNSIASCAVSTGVKYLKRLRNKQSIRKLRCSFRKHKPNQHLARVDTAQSVIEIVVNGGMA